MKSQGSPRRSALVIMSAGRRSGEADQVLDAAAAPWPNAPFP